MRRNILVAFAFSIFTVLATTNSAQAADWIVTKMSGTVELSTNGAQQIALSQGGKLVAGGRIVTGKNGRVRLVRGQERMFVGPDSVVMLPVEPESDGTTTILQQIGSVLFEVEKKNVQHFTVETPFLAAVVKGTRFTVSVDELGANVGVERGLVAVTDNASGEQADIAPGQTASVSAGSAGGLTLTGQGEKAQIKQGEWRFAAVEPASRAEQSTGKTGTLMSGVSYLSGILGLPQPSYNAAAGGNSSSEGWFSAFNIMGIDGSLVVAGFGIVFTHSMGRRLIGRYRRRKKRQGSD